MCLFHIYYAANLRQRNLASSNPDKQQNNNVMSNMSRLDPFLGLENNYLLVYSISRIQLRLPMGSTKVVEVESSDSLSALRCKISEVRL